MGCAAAALTALIAASPSGDPSGDAVVVGVLDAAPELHVSRVLDEASSWLREETALSMTAGDQVGLDRATLEACPADRLYGCLARHVLAIPARPRVAVLVARARRSGVSLLAFESETLARAMDASSDEATIYAAVRRLSGPDLRSALEGLRAMPGFEAPARARARREGCDGCALRVAGRELPLDGEAQLRLRPGPAKVELSLDGALLAALTATLSAGAPALVRVERPPPPPTWQRITASGLVLGGAAIIGVGIAVAAGRPDVLCVTRGDGCAALDPPDARVEAYEAAGRDARALAISGAAGVALGAAWWAWALLRDDAPRLWIE